MDLDDTHMLVNSKMVEQLRTMLEAEVRGPALTAV